MFRERYAPLFDQIARTDLSPWLDGLDKRIDSVFEEANNGHLPAWKGALEALPQVAPSVIDLKSDAIRIGGPTDLTGLEATRIRNELKAFHPWRKGPWDFFGVEIDAEWRSNLKWDRIRGAITPLAGRLALDIGSGNGYYCYRMAGDGAKLALGADPYLLYVMQSLTARKYLPDSCGAWVIPFGIESIPPAIPVFDTVFSMGVLYHRRSPLDHLLELKQLLRPGGELVLETLVIDGDVDDVLLPKGRYAKMRNTWFLPSCLALERWVQRCGFSDIRLADVSTTRIDEQRSTDWMTFDSLSSFLDPTDATKTVEGYPAPQRALLVATA